MSLCLYIIAGFSINFLNLSFPLALTGPHRPLDPSSHLPWWHHVWHPNSKASVGHCMPSATTTMPLPGPILLQAITQPNAFRLTSSFPSFQLRWSRGYMHSNLWRRRRTNFLKNQPIPPVGCLDSPLHSMGKLSPPFTGSELNSVLGIMYDSYVGVLKEADPKWVMFRLGYIYLTMIKEETRNNGGYRWIRCGTIFLQNVGQDQIVNCTYENTIP